MSNKISRRDFIAASALGAGATLLGVGCKKEETSGPGAAATKAGKKPFEGQTIRIFIYSGAWEAVFREFFTPRFEELTGATVILDPGWWDSIPKLKASPKGEPAFDLVLTDATQGYPAIREGMFQKLDMSALPAVRAHSPTALDNWVYKDGYGITYPDSVMTLAYRKDLIEEAPKGWEALLDPAYDGKLGMYNSFYMSLHTFAAIKAASEGKAGQANAILASDLQGVFELARAQRERVSQWWPTSTDMVFSLREKNCVIGNMHSTDMLPALRESPDLLGALVPPADRAFVQLMWVIPSDTPRTALAHAAIEFIAGEAMQYELAKRGSVTPLLSVAQRVAAEDPVWASIYPSTEEAMRSLTYYPYDTYFKDWEGIAKQWDETVLREG
jgi:putative spermidine/putrescine transport system substrate-binding protein